MCMRSCTTVLTEADRHSQSVCCSQVAYKNQQLQMLPTGSTAGCSKHSRRHSGHTDEPAASGHDLVVDSAPLQLRPLRWCSTVYANTVGATDI
jgi:hypothetical protein